MAYKFQTGDATLSGSLVQEGDIRLSGSFDLKLDDDRYIGIDSDSDLLQLSANQLSVAGAVSGSGDFNANSLVIDTDKAQIDSTGAATLASLNNSSGGITNAGSIAGASSIDGSGDLTMGTITMPGFSVDSVGNAILKSIDANSGGITEAGAVSGVSTLDASGLASLDGGIDVNGNMTVSTAGAIGGATTISGSGVLSAASLSLDSVAVSATAAELNYLDDDNLTAADLTKLAAVSATAAELNYLDDDNLTAADLTKLAAIDASAAELNYLDLTAAIGTATASEAVVLDASKNFSGISNLTASYFSGDGSGITNINVENLDAVGSDTNVQFNQNGEFGANSDLTYDGSGSLQAATMVSSNALSASAAVSAASFAADGAAVFGGSMTAVGVVAGGAVSGVSTLDASGLASLDGGINVNDNFSVTTGGAAAALSLDMSTGPITNASTISGSSTVSAMGGVFADDGISIDVEGIVSTGYNLIIENNSDAEKFYVSASNGNVWAAGAVTFDSTLDVVGGAINCAAVTGSGNLVFQSSFDLDGAARLGSSLDVAGAASFSNASVEFTAIAETAMDINADAVYFRDADGSLKKYDWADLMTAVAGPGITATDGQLSSDAASAPYAWSAGGSLTEGFCFAGDLASGAQQSMTLPASPSAGDRVDVKAADLPGLARMQILTAGSHTVDGEDNVFLESPYSALSFVYVGSNEWRII